MDFSGRMPLHAACQNGHLNVVKYFVHTLSCDLQARDAKGNTPLHLTALFGHLELVKFFIEDMKCDPTCVGFNGRIPLHDACQNGQLDVIKFFVESVNLHVDDISVSLAMDGSRDDVVTYLLSSK